MLRGESTFQTRKRRAGAGNVVWPCSGGVRGQPGPAQFATYADDGESGDPWFYRERWDHKDVPIISAGRGVQVGAARVAGPVDLLRLVQAVAQIESRLSDRDDVEIYVPMTSIA